MIRALTLIGLLLGPAVLAYWAGHAEVAHYLALGTVLAFNLSIVARPLGPFFLLIPAVYAAAAVTAQLSDGVAALIVAVAAAVGAASSQGFHRGLLSVLAAALVGSFEPATGVEVIERSAAMLAGCAYGFVVAVTAGGRIEVRNLAVHSQTALSYAVLLAVLTLVAWFAARVAGFPHGWWLPLAVAAIGEPYLSGSAERAVSRTAIALCCTVPLLALIDSVTDPLTRGVIALSLAMMLFTAGRRAPALQTFLLAPIIVLFATHQPAYPDEIQYLRETLVACAVVFTFSLLGKWVLWTLRPDTGRVPA
jgi:Fusaric acid resistance protein-like